MKHKKYYFLIEGEIHNFVEDDSDSLENPKIIKSMLKEGVNIGETFGMTLGDFETKIRKFKFKNIKVMSQKHTEAKE